MVIHFICILGSAPSSQFVFCIALNSAMGQWIDLHTEDGARIFWGKLSQHSVMEEGHTTALTLFQTG